MLGRDQVALVYKFSKEQAALQEHLKDLGKKPMLRRLDVPEKSQAELKMLSWLKRRRVHERPPPVDNQMEWAPVEDYPQGTNPSEMTGPARAPDPDNLRTEQPPSDNMYNASVGDAISIEDVNIDDEFDIEDQDGDEDAHVFTTDVNPLPPGISHEPSSPFN